MTADELQAIKARVEAATPGPWHLAICADAVDGRDRNDLANVEAGAKDIAYEVPNVDAAFIAHARTDVPALVAEVEELRAALVDAWDAGFHHSAEGWNGEYPFTHPGRPTAEELARLQGARDRDLADMT